MARILIAGCGDIGSAVGTMLVDDGHEVYGLKRHPPEEMQRIRYIKADLTKSGDIEQIDTNFDLVIYILTPDDRSEHAYRRAFVIGVNNLLTVFSRKNIDARFLFVSSTSVYGQSHGEWVDESSVTAPGIITGQTLVLAEKSFLSYSKNNCIVRFSGIYGRKLSHLLDAVVKDGMVQYEPPYYMNRIHREDCIRAIYFISNKMIAGEEVDSIYLASDDDPASKWDVFNYLAGKLGVERPEKAILPPDSEQNKRCRNTRLKQLGFEFKYKSYRQGFDSVEPSADA
jgi:nucleoside-diphosphate-sugar epimerase